MSSARASQEMRQGRLTGAWGPKGFSVCAVGLGTFEMVKRAFNGWLFVGVGLLSQTIKQMQQRMLELKKTLQKELVSDPSPRRWLCGAPQGPRFLMVRPSSPRTADLWEVRCWLVGQWPCHLECASGKGLCDPWHKPFL